MLKFVWQARDDVEYAEAYARAAVWDGTSVTRRVTDSGESSGWQWSAWVSEDAQRIGIVAVDGINRNGFTDTAADAVAAAVAAGQAIEARMRQLFAQSLQQKAENAARLARRRAELGAAIATD